MSSPASRSEPVRGDAAVSRDAPRQRILDAGEQVFADKGYARATVDDVIVMAATSRATFYRYFESKDDLFKELSRACFVEMRSVIRDLGRLRPAANGPGELAAVVSSYAELHQRHGGVIRAWTERATPPDSPLKDDAARVFGALLDEAARVISAARGTAGAGTTGAGPGIGTDLEAALLFTLVERSSFYVSSRHSEIDPARLAPTLSTMLHRAWFGGSAAR